MKDLIAKLQLDANCALGAIWMHIDAQEKRIAELEAQQAFGIGETYANALSRIAYLEKRIEFNGDHSQDGIAKRDERIAELEAQIAAKADTDKLREAISDEQIMRIAGDVKQRNARVWPGDVAFARAVLASTALQAPVREVPKQRHVYDWLHLVETKIGTPTAASAARVLKEFYEGAEPDEPLPAAPVQEPKP